MLARIIFIGFFSLLMLDSFGQDNTSGVFLTMKPTKKFKEFTKVVSPRNNSNKKFYVPLSPVISSNEFVKVSEITNDPVLNLTSFLLYFSQRGIDNIKAMTSRVEGAQAILVVNDTVIGEIKTVGIAANRFIQISGPLNSPDVLWAYDNIKAIIVAKP